MKIVRITPGYLKGSILIPPSKSLTHRAVIAASLSRGVSLINRVVLSEDILATIRGVQAFGAKVKFENDRLLIKGGNLSQSISCNVDCGESGSTLRFLIPIGLSLGKTVTYMGSGNLYKRPIEPYLRLFDEQGIYYSSRQLPFEVQGKLIPGCYGLPGNVSSQFVTGLMFALPLLQGDSKIILTEPLESRSYIDLTIDVLADFGIHIENHNYESFHIKGNQQFVPTEYTVEGDFSQAAFWIAAGTLGKEIKCVGLNPASKQGDRVFIDILKAAGASLEFDKDSITAFPSKLNAFHADVSQCPDIAPILAVAAAFSEGESCIMGAGRLRIKESDRLRAITLELNKLGASVQACHDSLSIKGNCSINGGCTESWGDHRIAMALAVASIKCINPIEILNSSVVTKSYPNFFEDFTSLGGVIYERNLG